MSKMQSTLGQLICLTFANNTNCQSLPAQFLKLSTTSTTNSTSGVTNSNVNSTGDLKQQQQQHHQSQSICSPLSSKTSSDRMTGLFQHSATAASVTPTPTTAVVGATHHHKMSGGIRRTVSSATASTVCTRSSPSALSNGVVVKSLNSNTQSVSSSVVARPTAVSAIIGKDPHKKLDRSFSEPAEKKNSASAAAGTTAAASNANGSTSSIGPSSRYKTELCRSFQEVGSCKYGDKCQFAHGEEELRTVTRHPKFKTENCKSFHSTGFCPYGPRCHFIHNNEEYKKQLQAAGGANGSMTNVNGGAVTSQRISFDAGLLSSHASPTTPPVSAGPVLTSPFSTTSPIHHQQSQLSHHQLNHHHQQQQQPQQSQSNQPNLVRPKALSLGSYSLGSSGDMSSPSSQSGSPTSLSSFFTDENFLQGLSAFVQPQSRLNSATNSANFHQQSGNSTSNNFSFSPDSAFYSFNGNNNANSGSSFASSSMSSSQKCFFGGSQPTLNSGGFSPEPVMVHPDDVANSVAIKSVYSLFSNGHDSSNHSTTTTFNDLLLRSISPIGGKSQHMTMMYPNSPESPVDSVASEIEALKLGEYQAPSQPTSFSPISSSFSTSSSLSNSSSPPNGLMSDLDSAFTFPVGATSHHHQHHSQHGHCGSNIPSSRLPIFAKLANHQVSLAHD